MIYLEVNHITDKGCDYYKFGSLHRAFEFISTKGIGSYTLSDMPFENEDYELMDDSIYKVVE